MGATSPEIVYCFRSAFDIGDNMRAMPSGIVTSDPLVTAITNANLSFLVIFNPDLIPYGGGDFIFDPGLCFLWFCFSFG
jgi:hypothetical protein